MCDICERQTPEKVVQLDRHSLEFMSEKRLFWVSQARDLIVHSNQYNSTLRIDFCYSSTIHLSPISRSLALSLSLRSWNSEVAECISKWTFCLCEVDDGEECNHLHTHNSGPEWDVSGSDNRGRWFLHRDWSQAPHDLLLPGCGPKRFHPNHLLHPTLQNHRCLRMKRRGSILIYTALSRNTTTLVTMYVVFSVL